MRGDQLARQWRIIRAIEASPNGLTVAEIAKREEKGLRTVYRDLEALQAAGFPLYTQNVERANRWAFVDTLKLKIPPSVFTQSHKVKGELVCFNTVADIPRRERIIASIATLSSRGSPKHPKVELKNGFSIATNSRSYGEKGVRYLLLTTSPSSTWNMCRPPGLRIGLPRSGNRNPGSAH